MRGVLNLSIGFVNLSVQRQDLHPRDDAGRFLQTFLLADQRDPARQALDGVPQLFLFPRFLGHLLAQDVELAVQVGAAGLKQHPLLKRRGLRLFAGLFGEGDFLRAGRFGGQPRHADVERQLPGDQFAEIGRGAGVVDPQKHFALFDGLALAHEDLVDQAAFEALDDLRLAGGDEPPVAACDFVQIGAVSDEYADDEQKGDDD